MLYYKDPQTGDVFAYESKDEREKWGAPDLVAMTAAEVEAHRNPPPTPEQLRALARDYLASTDWYVLRQMETGQPIPADVSQRRNEARAALSS